MRRFARRLALLLAPALLAGRPSEAFGATYGWSGGSGDWDTTSPNWTGAQSTWPAAGTDNDAVFGLSGGTVAILGGVTVDDLSFTVPGYRIAGNTARV